MKYSLVLVLNTVCRVHFERRYLLHNERLFCWWSIQLLDLSMFVELIWNIYSGITVTGSYPLDSKIFINADHTVHLPLPVATKDYTSSFPWVTLLTPEGSKSTRFIWLSYINTWTHTDLSLRCHKERKTREKPGRTKILCVTPKILNVSSAGG